MVSLTTILRTSAKEVELRARAATRPRRIREIGVLFMSRHLLSTIFLLLFVTHGRHFFGLTAAGIPGVQTTPAGKTGAACDEAGAALVGGIRPRPLDKHKQAVAEANQEKNVDEQPCQPGHEARDMNLAELCHCGGAADGGEAPFVPVVKRRAGHWF